MNQSVPNENINKERSVCNKELPALFKCNFRDKEALRILIFENMGKQVPSHPCEIIPTGAKN